MPTSPAYKKKKPAEHADLTMYIVSQMHAIKTDGWTTGYTDGSAKLHPRVVLPGRYGVCAPALCLKISGLLTVNEPQTNNRSEQPSTGYKAFPPSGSKLLIASYSDGLCSGNQAPVYKWKKKNWCTQKGPVPNAKLGAPCQQIELLP